MNDTDIRRPPYRPLFLVFDGMDGSGKTTQMNLLADRLRAEGVPVAVTAEPTASPDGKRLRQALSGAVAAGAEELATLFLLDRIGHNLARDGIDACLRAGVTVLCDRYYYSSIAYQGGDDSARMAWVCRMNLDCPAVRRPDACLLFDLEPETAMRRITARAGGTATEIYETLEQQTRIRARFRRVREMLAEQDRILTEMPRETARISRGRCTLCGRSWRSDSAHHRFLPAVRRENIQGSTGSESRLRTGRPGFRKTHHKICKENQPWQCWHRRPLWASTHGIPSDPISTSK